MMSQIEEILMPVVLVACYALGMALKSTKFFPDSLIPLTLFVLGGILAPFVASDFRVETVLVGATTGWAAVGLNQTIKQVIKDDHKHPPHF